MEARVRTRNPYAIVAALAWTVCALLRTAGVAANVDERAAVVPAVAASGYAAVPLHFEPADGGFVAVAAGRRHFVSVDGVRPGASHGAGGGLGAVRFERARADAALVPEIPLDGRSHYIRDSETRIDVPHYAQLRVRGIYRGIDLVYRAKGSDLEYDFEVETGADPRAIRLRAEGKAQAKIDARGDLVVQSERTIARHKRPQLFQDIDGVRVEIEGRYRGLGGNRFRLKLGRYDRTRPLTIDPVLSYSARLGGKQWDTALGIAVDAAGNAYVAGWTTSSDFPLVNAYDSRLGNGDQEVFVAKLNATGSALVYSTFIGGTRSADAATGIAVDAQGNAYVTGVTTGTDFPVTTGAYATAPAGGGGFALKLGPAGNTLLYSTYLPFVSNPRIAVDAGGNAHIAGQAATGFATTAGAYQRSIRSATNSAPFALKLNAAGTALVYATFVGGSETDTFAALALDTAGSLYLAGQTTSPDFPLVNPYQSVPQGWFDGFVAKLDASGSTLVYSTRLGGDHDESVNAIAIDAAGNAYVAGETYSANFPLVNAFQPVRPGSHIVNAPQGNAFVAKLGPGGNALVYSSYLGGEICYPYFCRAFFEGAEIPGDAAYGIAVDAGGHAIVTGLVRSYTFPLVDSRLGEKSEDTQRSLFVAKIARNGSALLYSSLLYTGLDSFGDSLTGAPFGAGQAIALDPAGNAYLALRDAYAFPTTPGALQTGNTLDGHSFVLKLAHAAVPVVLTSSSNPAPTSAPVTISAQVAGATSGIVWFFDGPSPVGAADVSNGIATISTLLPIGIRRLLAVYRDGSKESDSDELLQLVTPRTTCP